MYASDPRSPTLTFTRPPWGVNLMAFAMRFENDLSQALRVTVDRDRTIERCRDVDLRGRGSRFPFFCRQANKLTEVQVLRHDLRLAGRQRREVQKVVDEPKLLVQAPPYRPDSPL